MAKEGESPCSLNLSFSPTWHPSLVCLPACTQTPVLVSCQTQDHPPKILGYLINY